MRITSTEIQTDQYANVLAISRADDSIILSDSQLKILDLASMTARTIFPELCLLNDTNSAAAFSFDSQRILVSVNESIVCVDRDTLEETKRFDLPNGYCPSNLRFDRASERIAAASGDSVDSEGYVFFGSVKDGHLVKRDFIEMVSTVDFNGPSLLGSTYEFEGGQRVFRIRDFTDDTCLLELDLRDATGGGYPILSPSRNRLLLGQHCYGSSVEMIDLDAHETLFVLDPPIDSIPCLAFSPDGSRFAWGNENSNSRSGDYRVRVHDTKTGAFVHEFIDVCVPHQVLYSPKGSMICVLGRHDEGAWVWDSQTAELIAHIPEQRYPVCFSRDERWLISARAISLVE